jgi:hypothetical protein
MTAFRRRTVFATPVIAIISCGGPQTRPEPRTLADWSVYESAGVCEASSIERGCPKGALCNPPPPRDIECPTGIGEGRVEVVKKPDETCAIVPPGCTDLACATQPTACPLPYDAPRKLRQPIWTVSRNDTGCVAVADADTRAIPCPPSLGASLRVAELRSACVVVPDGCADEGCVGAQTACPVPAGKDLPALVWDIARTGNACTATTRGPIAGERTFTFVCPEQTTFPPRFQIRRADATAPCELFVGSGPGVPTQCPET